MSMQEWLNETLAVLVLYKKPLLDSLTFQSLTESLKANKATLDLFIYDNSPNAIFDSETYVVWKIAYQHDPSNSGVSKAYNEAAKKAVRLGKKWLILLDQDTEFPIESLHGYYNSHLNHPNAVCLVPRLEDRIGIISPFKFQLGNGIRVKSVSGGIYSFNNLQFVNSGLMISVDTFLSINGYDEDFPLDFSDYAFVEKLRGYIPHFILTSVIAQHSHSSTQNSTVAEELNRFIHFVTAARLFRKKYHSGNWLITLRILLRALKLSLRHGSFVFIMRAIKKKNGDQSL